jgi:hypothetical protein
LGRKSYADSYGFSENKLKTIAGRKKKGDVITEKVKDFADSTRLPFTYAQMRDLFTSNGLDYGKYFSEYTCL